MAIAPEPVPTSTIFSGWSLGRRFEDGLDEVLGLGAGDEDGGADVQRESIELLLAGDVLDGLVTQAAGDASFVVGLLAGREFAGGVSDHGDARNLQSVEEEQLGVASGGVAEARIGGELCGGSGDGLAEGHRLARVWHAEGLN